MITQEHDIFLRQNEDFLKTIVWRNPDRSPMDLTGCTAVMTFRQQYDKKIPDLVLQDGLGTSIAPTQGKVFLTVTAGQVLSLPARQYFYDVFVISSTGIRTCILFGKAYIEFSASYPPNLS